MRPLYPTTGSRKRAVVGWCLFDFANSSYTNVILMLVFPVFFREAVVAAPDNAGDRLWGMTHFAAMLIVVAVSPFMGAAADDSGRKKRLLIGVTLVAVLATALMATVSPGQVLWAALLFVIGTVGFETGFVLYNAFLVDISNPENMGRISGWGWGIGFPGGLAALGLCSPLIGPELHDAGGALVEEAVRGRQLSFLVVAGFFLVFALPAFTWLRESPVPGARRSLVGHAKVGLQRVADTLAHLKDYRETGKFILASLFYNDGITTILLFSAIYASVTFGFSSLEVVRLFLVLNVVAFPGAVLAGYLADLIGARRTLILTLCLWIGVVVLAWLAASKAAFWTMAAGAAIGMGSTQAVARSFMAQITPPEREAEFFGFYVLSGKFAAMFGPLLFGLVSSVTQSQRAAVLSLLPMFLIGLGLLLAVDEERARRAVG